MYILVVVVSRENRKNRGKRGWKMSGLEMKYFVLKPKGDDPYAVASRMAMLAYADAIMDVNRDLALDLIRWVQKEEG
jgi:hypothetical protein